MNAKVVIVNDRIATYIRKSLHCSDRELAFRVQRYLRERLHEESLGYRTFSERAKQILSDEISRLKH